jgi:hypothetical protein
MRNQKVLRLSDADFRLWVRLLAVASENDGKIPADEDLKRALGCRLDYLKGGLKRLLNNGLIDPLSSGYEPHNWAKFQYKSDTSTQRVTLHRAKRNVSVTPPDTETDTELPLAKANGQKSALVDPVKAMFDAGIRLLASAGIAEPKARSLLGKWKRDHGEIAVMAALGKAQREGAIDPVSFIEGCFRQRERAEYTPSRIPLC